jgi:TRAP-type C4-dicarboxylate transport system permease small subunit
MKQLLTASQSISNKLTRISEVLIAICGIALIFIVSIGIIFRYVFKLPLTWSYELSVVFFIWVSFQGAAYAVSKRTHVSFEFVIKLAPEKSRYYFLLLKEILLLIILLSGTILGFIVFLNMVPQKYQTIPLSLGWLYLALPVGFTFMFSHTLYAFLTHINQRKSMNKEP